jgi:hypothetical protein
MKKSNLTFEWSNFTRPTPTNLLFLVEGLKGILGTIAVAEYFVGNTKIAFWIMLLGALLDFAAKFLARAAKGEQQVTSVSVPAELAGQVEIKTEIKNE